MVGRGGLGEGGAGSRPGGRRVDDPRRVGDRPSVVRHRALLRLPALEAARAGARGGGVQQDLRHRAPRRAVGFEPPRAALAVLRAGARARRGVLRGSGVGASAVVRVECEPARRIRRPHQPSRGGVGVALVVADHQRRASGDARSRRDVRPDRVLHLRCCWARCARDGAEGLDAPDGRRERQGRLHPGALAERDVQERPDGDAPRRRAVSRRHWRRPRHGRHEVVRRPRARRRQRADHRSHLGVDHARPLGPALARHPCEPDERRRVARGVRLRELPHDRDRLPARARVTYLLRR